MKKKKTKIKKKDNQKAVIKKRKYKPPIDLKELLHINENNEYNYEILKNNIKEIDIKNIEKKNYNSVDKLNKNISVLSLTDKIIDSYKVKLKDETKEDPNKFEKDDFEEDENNSDKDKSKNVIKIDITNEVKILYDTIRNIIPYKIIYNNYIYNYEGNNPKKKKKITWHCQNYRKIKNLPSNTNKFCNSIIQGNRDNIESKQFQYFFKKEHSELCINLYNKIKESKTNEEKKKIKQDEIKETDISNKKEFNFKMENYIKNNKEIKIDCQTFIKYGLKFYEQNNLKEIFKIDKIYLKNLYYRIIKKYYQLNLENIYDYAEKLPNDENFCRNVTIKQLITKDKKQ